MLPITLFETGDSCGEVSLASLFEGKSLGPTRRETGLKEVANWCCRGGNSFAFLGAGKPCLATVPKTSHPLLTLLCFKHQNISPRKKSLAWMIPIPSASCSYLPWRTMTHFSYES